MKIGVTERGDASRDYSWIEKLNAVNGAILITKMLTDRFRFQVLRLNKPIIVHVTCTGYGETLLEPNVWSYKKQINACIDLINSGFPASNIVFRVDPIVPTAKGINVARNVIDDFSKSLYYAGVNRIRVSIVDEYKHVRERYAKLGWSPVYGGNLFPSDKQIKSVANMLSSFSHLNFEACAETKLASYCSNVQELGCVSIKDLDIMSINHDGLAMYENPQNRNGCRCLSCKTELLTNKKQCPNGCLYCYWR